MLLCDCHEEREKLPPRSSILGHGILNSRCDLSVSDKKDRDGYQSPISDVDLRYELSSPISWILLF
jgi:hypothetical protein